MNIYNIIELVKEAGNSGQELLIDTLIIGIEIGRNQISNKEVSELASLLQNLKNLIDLNEHSPFKRDEILDCYLNQSLNLKNMLNDLKQIEIPQPSIQVKKSPCPTCKCESEFQYLGQEMYRCLGCKRRFCLKCRSEYHPGKNCTIVQEEFQPGQRFKECRNCKQWVEILETDVQFINCFCKRSFCFKCGEDAEQCQCITQVIKQQSLFSTLRTFVFKKKQ